MFETNCLTAKPLLFATLNFCKSQWTTFYTNIVLTCYCITRFTIVQVFHLNSSKKVFRIQTDLRILVLSEIAKRFKFYSLSWFAWLVLISFWIYVSQCTKLCIYPLLLGFRILRWHDIPYLNRVWKICYHILLLTDYLLFSPHKFSIRETCALGNK